MESPTLSSFSPKEQSGEPGTIVSEDEKLARQLQKELDEEERLKQALGSTIASPSPSSTDKSEEVVISEDIPLEQAKYYFGSIDRKQAEAFLLTQKGSFFLIRESSIADNFAISRFNFSEQSLNHTLISPLEFGRKYYHIQDNPRMYPTVPSLVAKAPELAGYKPLARPAWIEEKILSPNSSSSGKQPNKSMERTLSAPNFLTATTKSAPSSPTQPRKDDVSLTQLLSDLNLPKLPSEDELENLIQKLLKELPTKGLQKTKAIFKLLVSEQEKQINEYDRLLVSHSLANKESISINEDDNSLHLKYMQNLSRLKDELESLRKRGDDFVISHKNQPKLFKITSDGQIMFCTVKRTQNPQDIAPQDMSKYAYFNVGVVDGGMTYEITSAEAVHYIDQIQLIVPASEQELLRTSTGLTRSNTFRVTKNEKTPQVPVEPPQTANTGVCIHWKNGKKSTFSAQTPQEAEELIETVGGHLKKFKQSTIKQVQLLKDIFKCKSTKYDTQNHDHQALLLRLWKTLIPDEQIEGLVSKQWKKLGFQGNNPATDFRGMGLLGLLNLIYFAEHHTIKARELVHSTTEYPWAATGINITHMLLEMLNLNRDLMSEPAPSIGWQSQLLNLFYYADNDDTFDELYSHSFLLFHSVWVYSKASYMDFPVIMRRTQELLEGLLLRRPLDLTQLIAWMEQLRVSYESYSN